LKLDQVLDERKVLVAGEEGDAMDVRSGGDHEVYRATAGLSTTRTDGSREPAPLTSHRNIDWQRIEGRLDDAEALGAVGALILFVCREDTKVQLGDRGGTDRSLEIPWPLPPISTEVSSRTFIYSANGSAKSPGKRSRSFPIALGAGVSQTSASRSP
jgi:hypothetical protein